MVPPPTPEFLALVPAPPDLALRISSYPQPRRENAVGKRAPAPPSSPALRTPRERLLQAIGLECLGLLCVTPLFHAATSSDWTESFGLLVLLALTMMLWSALYNSAFDRLERRLCARAASERPHALRIVHALGYEGTGIVLSTPLLVRFTTLGWSEALAADVTLSLAYAGYGYLYHMAFDRLRPLAEARTE